MKITALTAALTLVAATSLAIAQSAFTQYASPDGTFTVVFPGTPNVPEPRSGTTTAGTSYTDRTYEVDEGATIYIVKTADYSNAVTFNWTSLAAGMADKCGGTYTVENTESYQGRTAALIQLNCPAKGDHSAYVTLDQLVSTGSRLYQMMYFAPTIDPDRSSTFLNSLHIN